VDEAAGVRVGHGDEADWSIYFGNANEALRLPESPWRCPFTLDDADGNREIMLAKYRVHILEQLDLVRQLPLLRGHKLGCWCHRERPTRGGYAKGNVACHGDVLAELVEALPPNADEWLTES
jgi:hypothetical protein